MTTIFGIEWDASWKMEIMWKYTIGVKIVRM